MKIISTAASSGDFRIEHNSETITEVNYKNWFSSKATAYYKRDKIEILPKNVWWSKFDIFKNGEDVGDIIFNWKGNIIIRFSSDHGKTEKSWMIKSKGFWNYRFEVLDEEENVICILKPNMNWRKLSYNYDIEFASEKLIGIEAAELIIYCGFGVNLYMTMMSGAA